MNFSVAVVLCDIQNQLTSNPLNSKGQNHLVTFAKGRLGRIFWSTLEYFLYETTRPGCIVNDHFGTVTLCLQKISLFRSKTNITLRSQNHGK